MIVISIGSDNGFSDTGRGGTARGMICGFAGGAAAEAAAEPLSTWSLTPAAPESPCREFAGLAPMLARAKLPIDPAAVPAAILRPFDGARRLWRSVAGKEHLPADPRYVNRPAQRLILESDERNITIDGELVPLVDGRAEVSLGPTVRLALCSPADYD